MHKAKPPSWQRLIFVSLIIVVLENVTQISEGVCGNIPIHALTMDRLGVLIHCQISTGTL